MENSAFIFNFIFTYSSSMLVLIFVILNLYVPLSSSCPSGTIEGPIVGDCYKFFDAPTDWVNAENNCSQQDGHLSSISNVFTNAFIQNLLNNFTLTNQVFIGGSTIFRSKTWTWSDGTNFTYTNWAKGQPANSEVACASFNPSTGTWYSQSCFSSFPYLCKINAIASTTPRTTLLTFSPYSKGPTWPPGTCLNEYTYFNETGKCYKVYPGSNLSFPLAENRCQMDGAHLASIHSSGENNFIANSIHSNSSNATFTWIGLYIDNTTNEWKWTDATDVDYTNWGYGAPYELTYCGNLVNSEWMNSCNSSESFCSWFGKWDSNGFCNMVYWADEFIDYVVCKR